jgi:hypothetical protein
MRQPPVGMPTMSRQERPSEGWFYQQAGETCGPVSTEQLKELLPVGLLQPRQRCGRRTATACALSMRRRLLLGRRGAGESRRIPSRLRLDCFAASSRFRPRQTPRNQVRQRVFSFFGSSTGWRRGEKGKERKPVPCAAWTTRLTEPHTAGTAVAPDSHADGAFQQPIAHFPLHGGMTCWF